MKKIVEHIVLLLVQLHILTPYRVAKLKFLYKCHKWPNFEHPKDINEKINWIKFYGDTSLWPTLADKYAVRSYIENLGLSEYLIPLIGKWDSVDDINWDNLPNSFVMKCNNGSGDVVVCTNKSELDIEKTKIHFRTQLQEKLSQISGEPHYAFIKPCIIAEELLDSNTQPADSSSLVDYKIWVFDGKPMFTWCTWNRHQYHANVACYDMEWNFRPEWSVWTNHYIKPNKHIPRPECFDQMMKVASKLGEGIPVARIDLYIVNNHVYFGEITLTSQGGYMDFYTKDFLNKMGEMTHLPI